MIGYIYIYQILANFNELCIMDHSIIDTILIIQ